MIADARSPSLAEARALLGLPAEVGPDDARIAFRNAAKLLHPDRPGGDAARFRQMVAAYRVLQAAPDAPQAPVPAPGVACVEISPMTALNGGEADAVLANGRRVHARIPPGARQDERLRIAGGWRVSVHIASDEAVQIRGSDVWISVPVAAAMLTEGGRAVAETPLGRRSFWISRKAGERGLARVHGGGLPARGPYPQGDLFIRLTPETGAPESPARTRLRAFAAAWAA